MKWFFKLLFVLALSLSLLFGFAIAGSLMAVLEGLFHDIPKIEVPDLQPAVHTRIYDRDGNLMKEIGRIASRKKLVRLVNLPLYVPQAFVAIEDERFFSHFGIDFKRVIGALIIDLRKGKFAHGASTITQQLIRNVYLSSEKTLTRKIKEAILALKLEHRFTKHEILEMYLNTVYFGGSNYGIESASRDYFAKGTHELNIAETALLAGVLKAPNSYAPDRNLKRGIKRQRLVLMKMRELNYITERQYQEALNTKIVVKSHEEKESSEDPAPYYTQAVLKELLAMFSRRKVMHEGLRVFTALDSQIHKIARESFLDASLFKTFPLSTTPDLQGAFIVRDVKTGDVYSLIGGRDYSKSKYNRATQSRRQPGSCFKPIVYAAAFENGISPNLIINDQPLSYYIASEQREWNPENYGGLYHGPTVLRTALEHSYNMVAIKLLEKVGISTAVQVAHDLGIDSYLKPNLTLALGSSEVTPLELISTYSTFANQGIYTKPHLILRVEDRQGNLLYESKPKEREAISASSAYRVYSMLRSVVLNGSGKRSRVKGVDIGGKTGTNQDYIDAWFAGITPQISAIVTFGYNDRKSLGGKMPSSQIAAPVVGDFFKKLLANRPELLAQKMDSLRPGELDYQTICRTSGYLAVKSCRHKVKEVFSRKDSPQAQCPIHSRGIQSLSFIE